MNEFLDCLRDHKDCCAVDKLRDGGVTLHPPKARLSWFCLSGTRYQQAHQFDGKLCDFLFGWNDVQQLRRAYAIEHKSGHVDLSHVKQQIQNGANVLDQILRNTKGVYFYPVLVHCGIKSVELRQLGRTRVTFRGAHQLIQAVRSGSRLEDVA